MHDEGFSFVTLCDVRVRQLESQSRPQAPLGTVGGRLKRIL
jgi:hypothetical protein